jgi:hypothetical protein
MATKNASSATAATSAAPWTYSQFETSEVRRDKRVQAAAKQYTNSDNPEVWALDIARRLGVTDFKLTEDSATVWNRIDVTRFPTPADALNFLLAELDKGQSTTQVATPPAADVPASDRVTDEYAAYMSAINAALIARTSNKREQRELWIKTGFSNREEAWEAGAALDELIELINNAVLTVLPQQPLAPKAEQSQQRNDPPPREEQRKQSTALTTTNQSQRAVDRERFGADVSRAKYASDLVRVLRSEGVLREGPDFGKVPGTDKDTLFKPGAEKLLRAFRLYDRPLQLDAVTVWDQDRPFFYFRYQVDLVEVETGLVVASGIGSCNSMESKYGYRWVSDAELPGNLDKSAMRTRGGRISEPQFAIDKAETSGKYGKPASYWQSFRDAIDNGTAVAVSKPKKDGGTMKAWEIDGLQYAIVNPDIYSLVNTIDKMAFKRALIAATLIGTNASEHFSQDLEDLPGFGYNPDVIDAEIVA